MPLLGMYASHPCWKFCALMEIFEYKKRQMVHPFKEHKCIFGTTTTFESLTLQNHGGHYDNFLSSHTCILALFCLSIHIAIFYSYHHHAPLCDIKLFILATNVDLWEHFFRYGGWILKFCLHQNFYLYISNILSKLGSKWSSQSSAYRSPSSGLVITYDRC